MAHYKEIRVRPVVRYVITEFECDEDMKSQSSTSYGVFDNAAQANKVAALMASPDEKVIIEPARGLKIDWERGPDEPKEAIRWSLYETGEA